VTKALGGDSGTVTLGFSVPASAVDYLEEGRTLTITYQLTLNDGNGGIDTRDFQVIVTGTNDAPVINAITQIDLTEQADMADLSTTVNVTFDDVDLQDTGHTAAVTAVIVSGDRGGLDASFNALDLLGAPQAAKEVGNGTGTVSVAFTAGSGVFDYLSVGQSITLTYTLAVTDPEGGVGTQDFVITVAGSNDGPTIAAEAGDLAAETLGEGNAALSATGTLTVADVDYSDVVQTSVAASASATGAPGAQDTAALEAFFTVTGGDAPAALVSGQTSDQVTWNFDAAAGVFDYLPAGQSIVITYDITVTDSQSATARLPVVITV